MNENILLCDIGSTFTKVSAVDIAAERLLGTASAPTTADSDVDKGLQNAIARLFEKTGELHFAERFACSSAAGGLRMAASGLVPELTAEAARLACLGAGAKLTRLYAYELTDEDVAELKTLDPDIFLLTGGTDGGNDACILHNANMLSSIKPRFPILLAGNRSCAAACEKILEGCDIVRCENVLPRFGELNIADTQNKIRDIFLRRIIRAKGLSRVEALVDGILMPTPAAMMAAMELLAKGTDHIPGLGDLLSVDLGGATTDVYSMSLGAPDNDSTVLKGLPEPYAKRTVEGDLGMRYSAQGVLDAVGEDRLSALCGLDQTEVKRLVERIAQEPDRISETAAEKALDCSLAYGAVETAVRRHAGRLEQVYTPVGPTFLQTGKNLVHVEQLILTGGAIVHSNAPQRIASAALAKKNDPLSLLPRKGRGWVDKQYILSGMGLLSQKHPACALSIMKKELEQHGAL